MFSALLLAGVVSSASAPSEFPFSDAYFADWINVIESAGQLNSSPDYATALERAKQIEATPDKRIKALEGAVRVCETMIKGRISPGEFSRSITREMGGWRTVNSNGESRVKWIMYQGALKSATHVVCPVTLQSAK
jgi:hypothetical protein